MYIVTIDNDGVKTEIHGEKQKLSSGSVVQGINSIDSFSFTILPANTGFKKLRERKTLVTVYNTVKKRYEFRGRVLYPLDGMSEDGKITKEVVCESFFAFLHDTEQSYVEERNWTVRELLQHIIDKHNSMVEEYKHFALGRVEVTDANDNIYCGIQRKSTWETIKEKLIDKLGGELYFYVSNGVTYIEYLPHVGAIKDTPIELSRNMKSITREKNPSDIVTRVIPLGCKLKKEVISTDDEGNEVVEEVETEERLDISEINGGINYIEDEEARERYGIVYKSIEFDDVTEAGNLLTKGANWLVENNRVLVKYSITALDLSLLGLDIDDFEVCNTHPIKNGLLEINDTARIIKKTIDICDISKTAIEIGDNFKTLSDIQLESFNKINNSIASIEKIERDYVTNAVLDQTKRTVSKWIGEAEERVGFGMSEEIKTVKGSINKVQEQVNKNAEDMAGIVADFNGDIEYLQGQIDGSITSWFYGVPPTTANEPASSWTTDKDKAVHLGDLYYDTETGYCYRWQQAGGVYSWVRITDTDVTRALADAKKAQDTADNKRRVFTAQPVPPYDTGDLWVQGANGDIMRCQTARAKGASYNASDWVKASKYTDDTAVNNLQIGARNLYTNSADFSGDKWVYLELWAKDTDLDSFGNVIMLKNGQWGGIHQRIPASAGDVFTLSATVFGDGICYAHFYVSELNDSGSQIHGAQVKTYEPSQLKSTGTRVYATYTVQNNCQLSFRIENSTAGAKIKISSLKLERGDKPTEWTPAPEDVDEAINSTVSHLEEEIRKTDANIYTTVSAAILEASESYVKTSEFGRYKESVNTSLTTKAGEITAEFVKEIARVEGDMTYTDENGNASKPHTNFEKIYKYIKMKDGSLILGEGGDAITLTLENDKILFKKGSVTFGSWDGENLYTTNIILSEMKKFVFGNFAIQPRTDGSAMILKVGG